MKLGSANMEDIKPASPGLIQRRIVSTFQHPKYSSGRPYYDVGVALADYHIEFTEYVRPICLPMMPVDDEDFLADDFGTSNLTHDTSIRESLGKSFAKGFEKGFL